jgi:hypothetical protein
MADSDQPTFQIVAATPGEDPDPVITYIIDPDRFLAGLAAGETLVLGQASNEPIDLKAHVEAFEKALSAGHSVQIVLLDP